MIDDETGLIPHLIADCVTQEVARFCRSDEPLQYQGSLTLRAENLFGANKRFRKQLMADGNAGRDALYVFMRHWLAAILKKDHEAIYASLPSSFANGAELIAG